MKKEVKEDIQYSKEEIIQIGQLLWDKNLASGLNGNISSRFDERSLFLTAHATCLGMLQEEDILQVDLDGNVLGEGSVSTEKLLHTEIYKNFPKASVIVHTHTVYTNAFFLENEKFTPRIFEAKVCLGEVKGVEQNTPAVTDAGPVIAALKGNNIVALRNHGVVAMGETLFDCFLLIQGLEEAIKTDVISKLYSAEDRGQKIEDRKLEKKEEKKYKLFSQEQIDEIVRLVNDDSQMRELGEKTGMTMDLAVTLDETNESYRFSFQNGSIVDARKDSNAEFVINAPESVWRAVFNQEIDPFVATTQKKMNLKGDFAKISKWYAPCSRLFELWEKVPVE